MSLIKQSLRIERWSRTYWLPFVAGIVVGGGVAVVSEYGLGILGEDRGAGGVSSIDGAAGESITQDSFREDLHRFIRARSLMGRALSPKSGDAILQARRELDDQFRSLFRTDPRGAIAAIESAPEPGRSEMFAHLLEMCRLGGETAPILKLNHFSGEVLRSLDPKLQGNIWKWLQYSDADGIAAVLRGENTAHPAEYPLEFVDQPRDQPKLSEAIIGAALQHGADSVLDGRGVLGFAAASLDPTQLKSIVEDNPDGDIRLLRVLVRSLARKDVNEASSLLSTVAAESELREVLIESLAVEGANLDGAGAGDLSKSESYRRGAVQHVILSRENALDIREAISNAAEVEGGERAVTKALRDVWRTPGSLLPLAEALIGGSTDFSTAAAANFVSEWSKRDIIGASQALAQMSTKGPIADEVLLGFIKQIHGDSEAALFWSLQLENQESRRQWAGKAIQDLRRTDPAAADKVEKFVREME